MMETDSSATPYECANSRISDEDLLSLEGWGMKDEETAASETEGGISWSRTVQPPLGAEVIRREPRKLGPAPHERRRRRSSPLKRRGTGKAMTTIAE